MKSSKLIYSILVVTLFQITTKTPAQHLQDYITQGLENNIVLQQQSIALEQALLSLKTANSFFLPSSDLQASYTTGEGGRAIDLPIGDLLNPVNSTLNQLTNSNAFPSIENQKISFLPKDYYDVKLRTSLPILNTSIYYNRKLQSQNVKLKEYEVDVYRRELVKDIKVAYFSYLSALSSIEIYSKASELINENVRINEKLIENGKGLQGNLLRTQSEREKILVQLKSAQNDEQNAKKYFNFLLNKELNSPISPETSFNDSIISNTINQLLLLNNESREELLMLKTSEEMRDNVVKLNQTYLLPKINMFLDLGAQAENLSYTSNARYYLFGVQLDVPIFNGWRNTQKIKQAKLDLKDAKLFSINSQNKLLLKEEVAKSNLSLAKYAYQASLIQLQSAQSYFKIIDNGYRVGSSSLIEFLDARNQITSAELMLNISKYKVMIEIANVERETASYILTNNNPK